MKIKYSCFLITLLIILTGTYSQSQTFGDTDCISDSEESGLRWINLEINPLSCANFERCENRCKVLCDNCEARAYEVCVSRGISLTAPPTGSCSCGFAHGDTLWKNCEKAGRF